MKATLLTFLKETGNLAAVFGLSVLVGAGLTSGALATLWFYSR